MQNGGDVVESDFTKFLVGYFAGDQAVITNPYPAFRQLREHGPVLRVDAGTGAPWDDAWHVFDYATVAALLRDDGCRPGATSAAAGHRPLGRAQRRRAGGWVGGAADPADDADDGPADHTRLRRSSPRPSRRRWWSGCGGTCNSWSTASSTRPRRGRGRRLRPGPEVAYPLPTIVISRLLGLPEADWPDIKRWSEPGISFAEDPRSVPNAIAVGGYLPRPWPATGENQSTMGA
jgi:cytochrome P450